MSLNGVLTLVKPEKFIEVQCPYKSFFTNLCSSILNNLVI